MISSFPNNITCDYLYSQYFAIFKVHLDTLSPFTFNINQCIRRRAQSSIFKFEENCLSRERGGMWWLEAFASFGCVVTVPTNVLNPSFSVMSMWPQVSCLSTLCSISLIQEKWEPEKWDWTTLYILEWPKSRTVRRTQSWWGWSNRNFLSLLGKLKMVHLLRKTVGQFLTKLKHTLGWSRNHNPWYLPKGVENECSYKSLHVHVYSSLITTVNIWKQPWCSSVCERINKWWSIQTMD